MVWISFAHCAVQLNYRQARKIIAQRETFLYPHYGIVQCRKKMLKLCGMPLDDIIAKCGSRKDSLIPILQGIQKEYRSLPCEVLLEVCRKTDITPADLFAAADSHDQFRHEPALQANAWKVPEILPDACKGCTACMKKCGAIAGERKMPHSIDAGKCTKCGECAKVCKFEAIVVGFSLEYTAPGETSGLSEEGKHEDAKPEDKDRWGNYRHEFMGDPQHQIVAVRIGLGSCCQAQGSMLVRDEVMKIVREGALDIRVEEVGCVGMCYQTPLLETVSRQGVSTFYAKVRAADVRSILLQNYKPKNFFIRTGYNLNRCLEQIWSDEFTESAQERLLDLESESVRAFLGQQHLIAMQHRGVLDPGNLKDYCHLGGVEALRHVVSSMTPESMMDWLEQSGLRSRDDEGCPTHIQWRTIVQATSTPKQVVCNGGDGNFAALADRMLLNSFPFRIIEGMTIAARAVGASQGILCIRTEYPLAVKRIRRALELCYENNLLGKNILDSEFSFDLSIQEGAGLKPHVSSDAGLDGHPTLINNAETFALLPSIFTSEEGLKSFARFGTEKSKGTKVFALTGKIRRRGLIEVPMGMTLRQIVEEIGGGVQQGEWRQAEGTGEGRRKFKAVQIGGDAGGILPESMADTPVDFESLAEAGILMGSGDLDVLDDQDCIIEIVQCSLKWAQKNSCGKCSFCHGIGKMHDILLRLCKGHGKPEDLSALETLAEQIKAENSCGLGKTVPNLVSSTLRHFRTEYEAHVRGECPAGQCSALIKYRIEKNCIGCSLCVQHCPASAIPATPYRRHTIDPAACTQCDACRQNCPHNAIAVVKG